MAAADESDQFVVTQRGQKQMKKTTVGWELLVKWKDGHEMWLPLKDLKEPADFSLAGKPCSNTGHP